ncbi:MAG: dipeptide ABC transporter ATP-binding protein [Actinobacteria bacterium]|jgi:oligopeptide transport system ATP-binding protein|nr:dipeptide ABC transporter ATP-binding protein [Actinomycetota bacterium]
MAALLQVEGLTKHFRVGQGVILSHMNKTVKAVDDVSFAVEQGETLGLVGESGCGKSTTGRCINRLLEATSGKIEFEGVDVRRLRGKRLRVYRRDVQFIFQDPYASLNPRMTFGEIMAEPLVIHGFGTRREREQRCKEMLAVVGLSPEHIHRYPHEFSGGQRQRVGIARSLMLRPKMIVCDEPVSALDVSIQAQIINLLDELQKEFGLTYLFIAHDLAVVRHICDRVAVMYLGKIVELGGRQEVYSSPHHPYTESLLSAAPVPDPQKQRARSRIILRGDVPDPMYPPTGCRFHTRCPIARFPICSEEEPPLRSVASGHETACHFAKAFPISAGRMTSGDAHQQDPFGGFDGRPGGNLGDFS